ncbi:hypothetical protein P154DRAFT_583253 [Amniculicola lignicola CBS 123094]|uniref:Uncharacterized protein n=1 Tax=Amniculicola lignicola CBS 123094 TaxID=1392246 RepID=A0A6A5VTY5_9PLEO|nr:hypothetical protein P154DRAFT_583253 [Amniculicola lignicola CBS 123094]
MDDPNDQDAPMPLRHDGRLKDGKGRPGVKIYENGFKFTPNDKVRIKGTTTQGLRGPYIVSCTYAGPKYALEKSNGSSIDNGKKFDEDELEHAN